MDEQVQKEMGIRHEVLGIKDGWEGLVQPEPSKGVPGITRPDSCKNLG